LGSDEKSGYSIRFDPFLFEVDSKESRLLRKGQRVDLPPLVAKILVLLAENPERLVTRSEIKEALWPGESSGDFNSRINVAVTTLRDALDDDAERPRYVQTVRNVGYRFVAPVQWLESLAPNSAVPADRERPRESDTLQEPARSQVIPIGRRWIQPGAIGRFFVVLPVVSIVLAAMVGLVLRMSVRQPLASEVRAESAATKTESGPQIASVTPILPQPKQRIVIKGRGFGLHVPYHNTDSPYLAIRDQSSDWAAGRMIPQNSDEVMLDVESWTDTEIVLSGFSGDYGQRGWKLAPGDELEIAVWNPQTGAGPAKFPAIVASTKRP
jgi:DNA-binding winged helix-turn-helix (wHTH) protein